MKARQCPNCGAILLARTVAADSYDLACANCQKLLEISEYSRNMAGFAGIAAGAIAWWIASLRFARQPGALGWILPVFLSYLVASAVAALALMLEAQLQLRPGDSTEATAAVNPPISH
ncbi:MAG: hypothetical protein WA192_08275 [Candidatus Acidiferrales bacterium]